MVQRSRVAAVLALWVSLFVGCQSDDAPTPVTTHRQADTGGCALPSLSCDGVCRDLTSDRANCGACGRACGAAQVCSRGTCAASCAPSLTQCASDGSCHDLGADPNHCGACGRVCGSGEVCNRGVCAPACDAALTSCGSGACRDVMSDPFNCGACGRVCLAGEACTSGACALTSVCALGTATSTTAVVDQRELVSSTSVAARVGATAATAAGQSFTVSRTGFLSGIEVSLTSCGGALVTGSTIQLALRDEYGQTLASATVPASAVSNGTCPRFPASLTDTTRSAAVFNLGASCVPVTAGQRLRFVLTSTGATTNGTCPTSTRRCSNAPTVACTTAAQCAALPAIVSAGLNPLSLYAGGSQLVGDTAVAGASLTFKTHVTPYVVNCAGETACNGTCRDLTSDRNNCGACGRACASTLVCSSGACLAACGAGLTSCVRGASVFCANLQSDNVNCGACGVACAPGQVCAAGGCVTTCGAAMTTCGRGATAYCASTATDNANCGRCGNVCPAGTVCSGGACAPSCGSGTARCGASCVDLRFDPANCGACGSACSPGQVCSGGVCGLACGEGFTGVALVTCGTGSSARCADLSNDAMNCGACGRACPAGQVCAEGACALSCSGGTVRCDTGAGAYCASTQSDNTNCGGCGVRCGAGSACVAGRCDATCAPGQTACGGACRDLAHDPDNCGACGQTCAAGELCSMGVCASRCDATDTACGTRCVDTRIDPDNCSACGRVCPRAPANAIRACGDSTCGYFCAPGFGDCDAIARSGCEVDLRVTAAHCGACGRACALPHATSGCAAGACTVTACEAGWVDCNGDPSDGCELQEGAACPLTGLCATAVTGCYEHRPVCFATSLFAGGTPCRAAAGSCDVAEVCDGVNPMCPPDSVVGDTTCPSALRGEGTTTAMGTPDCNATYTFHVEAGRTYTISTCDSFTGDTLLRVRGACVCENDDACAQGSRCTCTAQQDGDATICATTHPGATATWSYTVTSSNGRCGRPVTCRAPADACDVEETCDGVSNACPADARSPEGAACDDGNLCTRGDTCRSGTCAPGAVESCTEGQCNGAVCDRATGRCIAKSDGTTCDDGDATTSRDACYAGRCQGHGATAAQVIAGAHFSLVRTDDGRVWSFGANLFGAADPTAPTVVRVPTPVPGLVGVATVSASYGHALALLGDGSVRAFGSNLAGQLGDGTTTASLNPVMPPGLPTITAVAAGGLFSLALASDGSVWAWGSDDSGQLAQGATRSSVFAPRRVTMPTARPVTRIAAGYAHALALTADGRLWAWGNNEVGQLGDGTTTSRSTPVLIAGVSDVIALAAGFGHSLALTGDGSVWAWGNNASSQLGDGTTVNRLAPQRVTGIPAMAGLAAGFAHSLARTPHDEVYGWGDSGQGQLAQGPTAPFGTPSPHATPAMIGAGTLTARGLSGGFDHTLALGADGRVWAFGGNERGQLGDDTVRPASTFDPGVVTGFGRNTRVFIEQAYDTRRTGTNVRETTLTVANVRRESRTFGRLFTMPVDGQVHAQPLYVEGAIRGRSVLYVGTENNTLYAYDADQAGAPLWQRNFGAPYTKIIYDGSVCPSNIRPNAGITSTPAVDLSTRTLYFVNRVRASTGHPAPSDNLRPTDPWFEIHAIDMDTGADRIAPAVIRASVAARTYDTDPVTLQLRFDPDKHFQRPGLLLQDGKVWVAFGGNCDEVPWHGWVMTFDAQTLALASAYSTTTSGGQPACAVNTPWFHYSTCDCPGEYPLAEAERKGACTPGSGGGIWAGGRGLASSGTGDVFFSTGNALMPETPSSTTTPPTPPDMSNALVRLGTSASGALEVHDWWMPSDYHFLDEADWDVGSAGPTLVPGTNLVLLSGKSKRLYLFDRGSFGQFRTPADREDRGALQSIPLPGYGYGGESGFTHGGQLYWNSPSGPRIYAWPTTQALSSWSLDTAAPAIGAMQQHAASQALGNQRSSIALSANGSAAGTGIVWAVVPNCRATLVAYNAEDLTAGPIWDSGADVLDRLESFSDMTVPTVVAGKVYVQMGYTASDPGRGIAVYGLLPAPRTGAPTPVNCEACARLATPSVRPTWQQLYESYLAPGEPLNREFNNTNDASGINASTYWVAENPTLTSPIVAARGHADRPTLGHCQRCHSSAVSSVTAWGTNAESLYRGWVASGLINTANPRCSRIIRESATDPTCGNDTVSLLMWIVPTSPMPRGVDATHCVNGHCDATCYPEAAAALRAFFINATAPLPSTNPDGLSPAPTP